MADTSGPHVSSFKDWQPRYVIDQDAIDDVMFFGKPMDLALFLVTALRYTESVANGVHQAATSRPGPLSARPADDIGHNVLRPK